MTTKFTKEQLANWIEDIKQAAKDDYIFSIAWFPGTEDQPFSIIAGWQKMFQEDYSDLFCRSKSQPEYVMCVKVVENNGPYAFTDFELMSMPTDSEGNIDDTCIPLEWDDPADYVAEFFMHEWERLMEVA